MATTWPLFSPRSSHSSSQPKTIGSMLALAESSSVKRTPRYSKLWLPRPKKS
jgi:hypothetical protein